MDEKRILTNKRQQELIKINRVLAVLVVGLSFSTGFLLAIKQSWITPKTEKVTLQTSMSVSDGTVFALQEASPSALVALLKQARYERVIQPDQITKDDLMALIWSAQGKITDWGERTVPSYKSAFPLELLVFARNVQGIGAGWYRFQARTQHLVALAQGESTPELPTDINPSLATAPLIIVLTAEPGNFQQQVVWNEAGGIAQNILLMSRERQLATYLIPGGDQKPYLWMMPLGNEQKMDISKKETQP